MVLLPVHVLDSAIELAWITVSDRWALYLSLSSVCKEWRVLVTEVYYRRMICVQGISDLYLHLLIATRRRLSHGTAIPKKLPLTHLYVDIQDIYISLIFDPMNKFISYCKQKGRYTRLSLLAQDLVDAGQPDDQPLIQDARVITIPGTFKLFDSSGLLSWISRAPSLEEVRVHGRLAPEDFGLKHHETLIAHANRNVSRLAINRGAGLSYHCPHSLSAARLVFPNVTTLELHNPGPLRVLVGHLPLAIDTLILRTTCSGAEHASVAPWCLTSALKQGLFSGSAAKVTVIIETDSENLAGWELAEASARTYGVNLQRRRCMFDEWDV